MAHWTLDEAVALPFGKVPELVLANHQQVRAAISICRRVPAAARTCGDALPWHHRLGVAAADHERMQSWALIEFLKGRRLAAKRKCGLVEFYCLKCRAPRRPVAELMEHRPMASGRIRIVDICLTCETLMHRFVANRDSGASLREFGVQPGPAHGSIGFPSRMSLGRDRGSSRTSMLPSVLLDSGDISPYKSTNWYKIATLRMEVQKSLFNL